MTPNQALQRTRMLSPLNANGPTSTARSTHAEENTR
jgi:hypothetical protein